MSTIIAKTTSESIDTSNHDLKSQTITSGSQVELCQNNVSGRFWKPVHTSFRDSLPRCLKSTYEQNRIKKEKIKQAKKLELELLEEKKQKKSAARQRRLNKIKAQQEEERLDQLRKKLSTKRYKRILKNMERKNQQSGPEPSKAKNK